MYLQALNDGVQGRSYTDNWGGGGDLHIFVFCPTDFF